MQQFSARPSSRPWLSKLCYIRSEILLLHHVRIRRIPHPHRPSLWLLLKYITGKPTETISISFPLPPSSRHPRVTLEFNSLRCVFYWRFMSKRHIQYRTQLPILHTIPRHTNKIAEAPRFLSRKLPFEFVEVNICWEKGPLLFAAHSEIYYLIFMT